MLCVLYEVYNLSLMFVIRELIIAEGVLVNIFVDNGMVIGIDLVGIFFVVLLRLLLFLIEV